MNLILTLASLIMIPVMSSNIVGENNLYPPHSDVVSLLHNTANSLRTRSANCSRAITHVALSPDASLLATADDVTASIDLWETATYSLIKTIPILLEAVTDLTFSPNSRILGWASSTNGVGFPMVDGSVELYDLAESKIIASLNNVADIVTELNISEDETTISFIGSENGYLRANVQVWDIASNTNIATRDAWDIAPAFYKKARSAYLGTTLSLGITNEFSYQIEEWDAQTNTVLQEIETMQPISVLAVNDNFSRLASGHEDGSVAIWNTTPLIHFFEFQAQDTKVQYLAFINDHQLILSSLDDEEQMIQIWNIESQRQLLLERNLGRVDAETFALNQNEPELVFANRDNGSFGISKWNYETDSVQHIELSC